MNIFVNVHKGYVLVLSFTFVRTQPADCFCLVLVYVKAFCSTLPRNCNSNRREGGGRKHRALQLGRSERDQHINYPFSKLVITPGIGLLESACVLSHTLWALVVSARGANATISCRKFPPDIQRRFGEKALDQSASFARSHTPRS